MFNVYLDTGSSDLWLANTSCLGCLPSTPHYLPSKSNSFQGAGQQGNTSLGQNVTIIYGTGMVVGVAVADTVTMGGLEISSQIFGACDLYSKKFLGFLLISCSIR
jgi:cathepsin D